MHLLRNIFCLYHETPTGVPSGGAPPDPGASGGAGTAVADGTTPQGQGQQPPQGGDGIRQFFPNVPDDHWAIMEPHVQQMGAQITQLQQQVAPLRTAFQQGYDGEHLARLAAFDTRFRTNPTETWIDIGRQLQESVNGQPAAVDPNVDLDYLAALARGEDPDAAPGGGQPPQPGAQPGQMPGASPEVMQYVQQLEAKVEELANGVQQDRTDRQTQVQDAVFDRQLGRMRDTLKKVGWPEDRLTQQALTARVLVHGGRFDQATQAMIDERNDLLKGWTQSRTEQPPPTDMPGGPPPTPSRDVRQRDERDAFKRGTRNASARLARLNGGTRG